MTGLTEQNFKGAAQIIGCDTAAIKSVYSVESAGHGYLPDGRVKILFEGHRFWKALEKGGFNPSAIIQRNIRFSNVLYKSWTKVHYVGGSGEWDRMSKAIELCGIIGAPPSMALESASYGSFQIMGENFAACKYDSAQEMIAQYNLKGEAEQLQSFCRFLLSNHLDDELRAHNWEAFAKGYNGTGYRENNYHGKLAAAYAKYKI